MWWRCLKERHRQWAGVLSVLHYHKQHVIGQALVNLLVFRALCDISNRYRVVAANTHLDLKPWLSCTFRDNRRNFDSSNDCHYYVSHLSAAYSWMEIRLNGMISLHPSNSVHSLHILLFL